MAPDVRLLVTGFDEQTVLRSPLYDINDTDVAAYMQDSGSVI